MKNTKINYLYRDASNYKVHNEVVVAGQFTEQQKEKIINCLEDEENFVPSQVGLPEKRFEQENDDDHPWFELREDGFEETEEDPTIEMTAMQLYAAFCDKKDKWEE